MTESREAVTSVQVPVHPCPFSPEVIDALRPLISAGEHVHDPFAGLGLRLANLCDEVGATYSGGDIEEWPGADHRVALADATAEASYPPKPFTIATSPVYQNKRLADYANGPLPTTKVKGRRDYGISLGRALHANNLARHTGKPSRAAAYWRTHIDAVQWWGDRVLVNVDSPIADTWALMLNECGYHIEQWTPVYTQRYGGLDNADKRAEYEILMVGTR